MSAIEPELGVTALKIGAAVGVLAVEMLAALAILVITLG
jgi:hypothetical protein